MIVYVLSVGIDSYDSHETIDSVHSSFEKAESKARLLEAEAGRLRKREPRPLDWLASPDKHKFFVEFTDCEGYSIDVLEVDKDNELINLIKTFGKKYCKLITSAIAFLDKEEPSWSLAEPIDRVAFLKDLIDKAEGVKDGTDLPEMP